MGTSERTIAVNSLPDQGCAAPSVQLFFCPDGDVRVCCRNERTLGNIADMRLSEIWEGERRRQLVAALAVADYTLGCTTCANEIATEGREGSYPATFDLWTPMPGTPSVWPTLLDFNVSIACNLQCVQCNGEQSSSIRIHREHRPPLASRYDDDFFEDLPPFLRNARRTRFAGGEPFLAPENFRIWDLVAQHAPGLECTVITNATQWNDRVEKALATVPMGFIFSIDGITRATYESIRVGADFDAVMANVDRFQAHADGLGTWSSVNFCLMVQNHFEFADLLLWAERRHLRVDVSVVRDPAACAIARLPQRQISEIYQGLIERNDELLVELVLNRDTWVREVDRIGTWAAADPADLRTTWGISGRMALMFNCEGDGPYDSTEARRYLEGFSDNNVVATVIAGNDERLLGCTAEAKSVLGLSPADVAGRPVASLNGLLEQKLGPQRSYRVLRESPDRVDATARFGDYELTVAMIAARDVTGWADTAEVLIAVRQAGVSDA